MLTIQARNLHGALLKLWNETRNAPAQDGPLVVHVERPAERVLWWPTLGQSPAERLQDALPGLVAVRPHLGVLSKAVAGPGWQLATPSHVMRLESRDGVLHGTLASTFGDPFEVVWGSLGLQMSLLLELMAIQLNLKVGGLTYVLSWAQTDPEKLAVEGWMPEVADAYTAGLCRPWEFKEPLSDLWDQLGMFADVGAEATGYTSPFVRHVLIPIVMGDPARCQASDWARALEIA
jgi:hypothetical protein